MSRVKTERWIRFNWPWQAMNGWYLAFISLASLTGPVSAADWPHWRGPNSNGISMETGWLTRWPDAGPTVSWKANVGLGLSSFAVAQKRVLTAGNDHNTDTIFCFDAANGKVLWRHSYAAPLGDKFFDGGTAATPTVDGESVYTLSRWGDVFCLEAATGKVVWSKNIHDETGVRVPGWGFGGSPVVVGDLLLLNAGEQGLSLQKASGKIVWQSANKDAGYSTPLVFQRGGRSLALFSSGQGYTAADLATGAPVWQVRWLTEYGVNATDPIVEGDRLFISTGYGKGAALWKLGAGEPEMVWKSKVLHNQLNSSLLINGYLYGIDGDTTEKAALKCVELASGVEKWSQPGIGSGGLIAADGKLIVLSEGGELLVAPVSPERFQATARAQVLGGKSWTTPVLAEGAIYCRNTRGDVVCLDVRDHQSQP